MRVVVNYPRGDQAAADVVADIGSAGGHAMAVRADVRAAGAVDALVHNALTPYAIKPFQDLTWNELGGKLDDEIRAAFVVTKAVLPAMTERGWGRLIHLGTALSHQPRADMIALGMAKAALTQFARYLEQELGPRGITVSVVEPGPVAETRISRVLDDEQKARQVTATPLARPADVAHVAAFHASADNAFMTGTTAAVNGGMSMY